MNDLPLFDPFKALAEIRRQAAETGRDALPQKLPQELLQAPAGANHDGYQGVKATSAASAGGRGAHISSRTRVNKEKEKKV
jgi:hypothetical protein